MAAAAAAATGVLIMVERPLPARPTRTIPVLVTGGSVAITEAVGMPAMAIADGVLEGLAEEDMVGAIPPPIAPEDAIGGFVDRIVAGDEADPAWVVLGTVAGCEEAMPEPDTVMTTMGLPAPHLAETSYCPALTPLAIVAVPVKLTEPLVIDACPPAKAAE